MLKNAFFHASFFLLLTIAFTLIISNISFLFNFDINFFNILISFFLSVSMLIYLIRKPYDTVVAVVVALIISVISYYLAINYFDTSYDGQGYHQETIFLLKNGWNPIYEESHAFRTWINYYQKGNEIIQANIYLLTNKVESGKMLNLLLIFVAFFTSFALLDTLKIKYYYKYLISFIVVFNPVVFTQAFTYYLDANWYLSLVILLTSLLSYFSTRKNIYVVNFILSAVIFCSLKLTSIPVFIVFSIFGLVYYFLDQKKILMLPFLTIFVLSLITNIHPFLTNLKNGFHIFHPFMGAKKVDILNQNIPEILLNKNRVERLFISLFSDTTNANQVLLSKNLKIPFSTSIDQLFINYDTRLGGFGFLFSGIIMITLLIFLYSLFVKSKSMNKRIFGFIIFGILCTILINPASWWSRLSAQIWLLPIVIIVFGLLAKNKWCLFLSHLTLIIFILNILLPGYVTYRKLNDDNKIMNQFVNSIEKEAIILDLSNDHSFKQYYLKFKERNIKYEIRTVKEKKNLAPFTPDVYYEIENK